MAYSSWSVVFGEQPSAAKWNILGTNDAHFNTLLGAVGVRNPYCFKAYDSAGTTLTDASFIKIALATEVYDYNNNFASSTYTAPVAGVYHFDSSLRYNTSASTPVEALSIIYVNGSANIYGESGPPTTGGTVRKQVSGELLLAANDTVELYHYQDSATAEATTAGVTATWFSGHLVHAV